MSNIPAVSPLLASCSRCARHYCIPNMAKVYRCTQCGDALVVSAPLQVIENAVARSAIRPLLDVQRFSFWAFVELGTAIGVAGGVVVAAIMFFSTFFGEGGSFQGIPIPDEMPAKLYMFLWVPLILGLQSYLLSVFAYLPLNWWMKRGHGVQLQVKFSPSRRASRAIG